MATLDPATTIPQVEKLNYGISITIASVSPKAGAYFSPTSNAVTIKELRCTFDIDKSLGKHPNTGTLEIYNLSEDARNAIAVPGLSVDILGGYNGDLSRIFFGDTLYATSERKGADWVTKVQLGTGLRAFNYARIKRSYPANTPYTVIAQDIAASMNLDLPNFTQASQALLKKQTPSSVTLQGPAQTELTRILNPLGMAWSIQEESLIILAANDVRADEAIEINEDNGMIGSPAFGRPDHKGRSPMLTVKCLPNSLVAPGKLIHVEARTIKGYFRVEKCKHKGDTWGNNRETSIEARQVPGVK